MLIVPLIDLLVTLFLAVQMLLTDPIHLYVILDKMQHVVY
jgi:hypothetical protein